MARFRQNNYATYMPPLENIQVGNDGSLITADVQPERPVTLGDRLNNRLGSVGGRIADALLGKQAAPTDNVDVSGDTMNATISTNPRVGGFLNDFASGYRENYNNRFDANNLAPNENKNWATRLGEGLGTVGRFVDSPLGRFALAAGLNSALGYNNSLQEGLTAGVGRQNAMTADRLYRQQLKRDYGYTDDDLADIRGNINSDLFNSLTKSQNSAQSLEIRKQTADSMNRLRELQIEKQKIINSNLPEQEKAKTLKMLAEAEHAEEMQLARINYYNNAAANPLGWANFGLRQEESERKNRELEAKIKALEDLTGGGNKTVKIKAPDGSIKEVPASQKDYYIKKGGVEV